VPPCSLIVGFGVVGMCCVSCATCCVMYSVLEFRTAYVRMEVYNVLTDTKLLPRNSLVYYRNARVPSECNVMSIPVFVTIVSRSAS